MLLGIDVAVRLCRSSGSSARSKFDLAADPDERENLIGGVDPERLKQLRSDLLHWRSEIRAEYAAHHSR